MKKVFSTVLCLLLVMILCACGRQESRDVDISRTSVSWCPYSEDYLTKLRDTYELENLIENCTSDFEKVRAVTMWVSGLWEHDGENVPEQNDPMYILDQVIHYGQQYRCVEYGIVISGCLNALGIECRQINLKTKEVEETEFGAGHVGSEAYLADSDKWVFIDGQWGAIPMSGDNPLSAYEFGEAVRAKDKALHVDWVNNVYQASDSDYFKWIEPYLFYLDSFFIDASGQEKSIMFVPKGGKNVTVFQRKYKLQIDYYVRDVDVFYITGKISMH